MGECLRNRHLFFEPFYRKQPVKAVDRPLQARVESYKRRKSV